MSSHKQNYTALLIHLNSFRLLLFPDGNILHTVFIIMHLIIKMTKNHKELQEQR